MKNTENKSGEEDLVNDKLRQDWNEYIAYLDKKGLKGKPDLDKNDLGGKMIDEYRKVNPKTSVSRETIPAIQEEFKKYRDWSLEEIKAGRGVLAEGVTPETYMKNLSIIDGIPGQRTTSFSFPRTYLNTVVDGKVVKRDDTGFGIVKLK